MKIQLFAEKLFIRLSRNRRIDGLWVGVLGDKSDDSLISRVEEALVLIKQHDIVRYKRIHRDIERIWIVHLFGLLGEFNPATKLCRLDFRFVRSASPELIASTIVHEATHAHPWMRRIGYAEKMRHGIEQICMRQELAFARRLPNGEKIRREAEAGLALAPSFWSTRVMSDRRENGELAAARDVGLPDWLTNLLRAIRNACRRLNRLIR